MWEIESSGVRKTVEAWGVHGLATKLASLDLDTLTFSARQEADQVDLFPYRSLLKLFRGDVKWFEGVVIGTPKQASARFEGHEYVVAGPWWFLENNVFRQTWTELANQFDPDAGTITKGRSRLILGLKHGAVPGTIEYATTKEVIEAALLYVLTSAAEQGLPAPFQIGELALTEIKAPTMEVVARTCGEVVHLETRWSPDVIGWFDYRTTPPTFQMQRYSAMTAVTLEVNEKGTDEITGIQINPREDLRAPAVVIEYERINVVNGVGYPETLLDTAPPGATGREFGALVSPVNLEGAMVTYTEAPIACAQIDAEAAEWWAAQYEPLSRPNVKNIQISGVERTSELPRELTNGNVTTWMLAMNERTAARETIKAIASYEIAMDETEGAQVLEKRIEEPISTEVIATDLTTGVYRTSFSASLAEPVPIGLANYLYTALNRVHFDGSITISEEEVTGKVAVGNLVNLAGLRAEWATMNAVVQSVTEDIDQGRTTIVIGPPKHLGKDDIIEWLQTFRQRIRITPGSALTSGQSFSASPVSLGKETPIKNSNLHGGRVETFTVAEHVVLDRAHNPGNKKVRLRELAYCDNGVEKKILVFASEPYSAAG